jgi:hypothetical protein
MYKNATKCNETIGKWCKTKHGASKIIDTFETYHPHLVLKRLTGPKELPALDKEMRGFSPPVLVDVGVPGTPSIEHLFRRKWWCITTPTPFRSWPRVAAGASTAASVVVVLLPWSIMVVAAVIVYVACYYHIRRIRILVAVSASFLS